MKKGLFLILVLLIIATGWFFTLETKPENPITQTRLKEAEPSIVYTLKPKGWLEFELPPKTLSVKLVTNADLPSTLDIMPEDNWPYAIEYQLIGQNGQVIERDVHHFKATVKYYQDPRFEKPVTSSFYLSSKFIPSAGKLIHLNFKHMPDVKSLRIRLLDKSPIIHKVSIRVYARRTVPDYEYPIRWYRLNQEQKEKIAKGSLFPPHLLSEAAVRNLISETFRPIAPSGIKDTDYIARNLYTIEQASLDEITPPVLPKGVFVDQIVHGVIPLPKGKNAIRLEFEPANLDNPPPLNSQILIRWQDRTAFEFQQFTLNWEGKPIQWEHHFSQGQLTIMAAGQLVVRAYELGAKPIEITPEPLYLRTFVSRLNEPVSYRINHIHHHPTLFRIDFRLLLPDETASFYQSQVDYALIDKHGNTIKMGSLTINPAEENEWLSQYERVAKEPVQTRVSSPVSYFFVMQPEVAEVRFSSHNPVLLRAYNRPYHMPRSIKVPEAYYFLDEPDLRQPAWFSLNPIAKAQLLLNNQSVLLTTQPEPPEVNWAVLVQNYFWEDFHPLGNWFGRLILTPIDDYVALREEALANVFQAVPSNTIFSLTLRGFQHKPSVDPRLAYVRKKINSMPFKLKVDGKLHYKGLLTGQSGEILLPPLSQGKHTFEISSYDNASFFMNHTSTSKGNLLKRLVNYLGRQALEFHYEKLSLGEETLSLRYYVPYGTTKRSKVAVEIEAPQEHKGPLRSWSLLNRVFDIEPNLQAKVPVLNTPTQTVDKGRLLTIPLGEDVKPGVYKVRVTLLEGEPGYVLLSRLLPKDSGKKRVFIEPQVRDVKLY
ncbi:hypothetical protein [Legionella impletisoli]|uniref:Uncharacterized protein n=1 Tax=Legionella impletisoli TaxID=343510 RepID=A0A917JVK2_9GAMM|nr:hypothetical protein [Legionella impletisoli]GGI88110.1 hypothetical protein GCM10007966_16060 [Legionella impletisoli]